MKSEVALSFKERIAVFFVNHGPHTWGWVQAANRNVEQKKMAAYYEAAKKAKQDACLHLKGTGNTGFKKDYAVGQHTFIDGHVEVKCLICSKQFKPQLPETLFMLKNTTNTKTSSEHVKEIKDREYPLGSSAKGSIIGSDTIWTSPGWAITKKIMDMRKLGISRRTQRVQKKELDKPKEL